MSIMTNPSIQTALIIALAGLSLTILTALWRKAQRDDVIQQLKEGGILS